ncbi:calcofluor white hypersensitive protein [Ophiostoma piceae UAMH 11346]|uniref:Calcofluor white hypersensitive protein n=1 Tax=Ophiostoma piceae (strain UAMH 11346) TaxID=1262450 RepID=S3BWP3_OPHP1|nr:calcofluor white hypersensitive protein [Ophiostoma piceae UAMH 11346]
MSRSRAPLFLGLAVAGGAGYYLYSAGGSPKVAEKQFEHDLKSVRDRATSSSSNVKTDAEKYGAQAGAKLDSAVAQAQNEYNKATTQARDAAAEAVDKAETYGKDVRSQVNKSIDAFDKKVEDAASKTKSGVSSWFGGK